MILSRIIGTVKNEDGTIKTKGKISQFSVFIGSSPAKGAYCIPKSTKTPFEVYNNFLLENAPVNTFKQLKYQAGDTMNSTGVYDSYLLSTTITSAGVSTFDSTSKVKWFDPEDKSLYRTKTGAPAPGEWPSPVFIETPRGNVIQISEDSSFTKYYEYAVKIHVTDIYNLIPGKHYFYRILEGSNIVKTGEFDTKGQVRMIRLNALRNVRDCGGWPTVDGENRFKYGIIFRGSALGFFVDDSINTAANRALDLSILENDFGVTGEVDLNGDFTIDPFYVGHNNSSDNILSFSATCYYGMPTAYSQFYNVLNFILQRVANGGAVYVHCEQGRDRTGSFVSVIQALCGVCDDGILKDYEITTFWGKGTYRYYLEHDDTQNASRDMWKEFASSGTTQERVQAWFKSHYVANSIGNKSTAEEAIDYVKSLLLEPLEQQEEEQPVTPSEPEDEIETFQIENPTIKSYLTASKRSGNNAYTMNDLQMQAHTPSDSEGDWSSYKPVNMTKGVSLTDLKNIECPPGSGLKFMKDNHTVQNYKYGLLLTTDVKTEAKPNYYSLNDPNIDNITITDSVTKNTYVIKNYNDTTSYILADFGGVTDRFTFDSLPQIGTSTYAHFLERVKPGLRKLGVGCKLALLPGDALSKINNKYTKFNTSCTFTNISLVNYYDETEILKSNITPLRTLEYTSDFDWSAFDDLAGTLAAPNRYYILIFKSNNSYYAGVEIKCGPLHQSTPTKIWNLIPGRCYHYEAKDASNNVIAAGNIKPEGQVRMLFLEGVYNIRDLGGWPCYDDNGNFVGRIAYDRLYRGSRPETDTTYWHRSGATMNDRRMMTNFIKLGKQLDLRESDTDGGRYTYLIASGNTSTTSASAFGLDFTNNKIPRVRVSQISYWAAFDYTSISDGVSKVNPIRQVFLAIGEIVDSLKNNKSTYFNCAQGADRTGTLAMVVEALIGANDDALLKDWELTSFSGCLMENTKGSYLGSMSDYRALHTDCADKASSNSGSHDLVKLIQTSNYLQGLYNQNSLSKNIVEWFKEVSAFNNIDALTSNTVRYMHSLGLKEEYNHAKATTDSSYVAVDNKPGTIASSVSASYLGAINTTAGTAFTNAEQVMDYLKWKLIDWRSSVKTMAVLGDSQSAYKNDNRCPLQDLWWYKFAQSIGLDPDVDVNNSSIGNTMVSRNYNNTENMGCSWSRINNLKVNGKDPDIIFVMMGGNDWVNSSISLGTYTSGDTLPGDSSTPENLDFKPAFALMLSRIKNTYQNSLVVCINEPRVTNATVTGHDWDEWMYAQIEVAKEFNCPVIDLCHVCGNVIKSTLQSDNTSIYKSDQYVHLNALGHELIANVIK